MYCNTLQPPGQRYIVQLLKAGHEAQLEAPQSMPVDAPKMESLPLLTKVGTLGGRFVGGWMDMDIDLW